MRAVVTAIVPLSILAIGLSTYAVAGKLEPPELRKNANSSAITKSLCDGLQLRSGIVANLQPFLGCITKTDRMRKADAKFLKTIKNIGLNPKSAARKAIKRGWKHLKKRDYDTAMRRFNQAWLLDPDNPDIQHGFAVVLTVRDKNSNGAEILFKHAIANPNVWNAARSDYARLLLFSHRPDEALFILKQALSIDPNTLDAYMLLANAEFDLENLENACKYARKALKRKEQFGSNLVKKFCDNS